jgi:hypothetical protein
MNLASLSIIPRYIAPSSWWQHVPVAHWLVDALKPARVVELGTHYGVSFFAFCEAAQELSDNTFVYAVDTWLGDEHSGIYNENVYTKVVLHWEKNHRRRSRLVRSTFDAAVAQFEDQSIDILHIDGFHTYDAVKHDYETWLPKLKRESIVLFHDINVREQSFGVWKLWEKIKHENITYEFMNGHGLGILVFGEETGKKIAELPLLLKSLQAKGELLEIIAQSTPGGCFGNSPVEQLQAEVEQARAETEQVALELKNIKSSEIWKLTKPIRAAIDNGKKLLKW